MSPFSRSTADIGLFATDIEARTILERAYAEAMSNNETMNDVVRELGGMPPKGGFVGLFKRTLSHEEKRLHGQAAAHDVTKSQLNEMENDSQHWQKLAGRWQAKVKSKRREEKARAPASRRCRRART